MNAVTEMYLQNEVDPISYLVHGCLLVPPTMAQFLPSPRASRSMGLLLEAQESMGVCANLYCRRLNLLGRI